MPTLALRTVVWTLNTEDRTWQNPLKGKGIDARLEVLTEAVRCAREWFVKQTTSSSAVLNVFVGPEYFFMLPENDGALGPSDLAKLEAHTKGLSEGILLIPGTILWKKSLNLAEDGLTPDLGAKYEKHKKKIESGAYEGDWRLKKLEERLKEKKEKAVAKWLLEEKSPHYIKTNVEYEGQALADSIKRLKQATPGTARLVYNTAFVYYDGARLLKYHKRGFYPTDIRDRDRENQTPEFVDGAHLGLFTVPKLGIPCGIEICADHYGSELRMTAKEPVFLHFITSAHVDNFADKLAVKNGFVVHASSLEANSGFFEITNEIVEPGFTNPSAKKNGEVIPVGTTGKLLCFAREIEVSN